MGFKIPYKLSYEFRNFCIVTRVDIEKLLMPTIALFIDDEKFNGVGKLVNVYEVFVTIGVRR